MDSAMTTELFVLLDRRRGGWLEPLIDILTDSAAWWLPGPWWWYVVVAVVGVPALRLVIGGIVSFFRVD